MKDQRSQTSGKILIFDYDGTIVDSLQIIFQTSNHISRSFGRDEFTMSEYKKLYEDNFFKSCIELKENKNPLPKKLAQYYRQNKFKFLIKLYVKIFIMPKYFNIFQSDLRSKEIKLFDGIKEVLDQLSRSNKIIIVTSNLSSIVEHNLKKHGLNYEVLGADKGLNKVKKINKIKSRHPNSDYYYIGDTTGDIKEAKQANVKTVAVSWGFHDKKTLEKSKPDYIFNKVDDLLTLNVFKTRN